MTNRANPPPGRLASARPRRHPRHNPYTVPSEDTSMRLRPILFALVPVAMIGLLIGCGKNTPQAEPTAKPGAAPTGAAQNADVGAPLYVPVAAPKYQTAITRNEPIVISNAL